MNTVRAINKVFSFWNIKCYLAIAYPVVDFRAISLAAVRKRSVAKAHCGTYQLMLFGNKSLSVVSLMLMVYLKQS